MHRIPRLAPAALAVAAALAVPAVAQAKPHTATVLHVNRAHHRIELVDGRHVVRRYTVRGRLPRRVSRGTVVAFSAKGKRITKLHAVGRAHRLSYLGKVVASSKRGVVLKLADGRRVKVGRKSHRPRGAHARAAGTVSISVEGLKVGQVVLITEAIDGAGNVSITIKLVQAPDPTGGEDQDAVGTVTAIAADGSTITVAVDGQGDMTFQTDADLVDGFAEGDQVDVTYFQEADGTLVADDLEYAGDGSGDDSGDGSGDLDAVGTVTAIAADGSTITVMVDGQGDMTFQTDADLVDGFAQGDQVDVSYFQDADGTLVADDVEYADGSSDPSDAGDGSADDGSDG